MINIHNFQEPSVNCHSGANEMSDRISKKDPIVPVLPELQDDTLVTPEQLLVLLLYL